MEIPTLYHHALLAQMCYADGLDSTLGVRALSHHLSVQLQSAGVTVLQAQYFAANFQIVSQQQKTSSGFSATLFRLRDDVDVQPGEQYYLAVRGSDDWADWFGANMDNGVMGVARHQLVDMLNFYLRLNHRGLVTQYQCQSDTVVITESVEGWGVIEAGTPLVLVGHSLGGHLASVFSLLLPEIITRVTTFNSAGSVAMLSQQLDRFVQQLAEKISPLPLSTFDRSKPPSLEIVDVSSPRDQVSHLGQHFSDRQNRVEVVIESSSIVNVLENHSLDALCDSLAVMHCLHYLDHSMTVVVANQLFYHCSAVAEQTLESIMELLLTLFFPHLAIDVVVSDHNNVYAAVNRIIASDRIVAGQYLIRNVDEHIVPQALAGDVAALYTLLRSLPFVIDGITPELSHALYGHCRLEVSDYPEAKLQAMGQYLLASLSQRDKKRRGHLKMLADGYKSIKGRVLSLLNVV